MTEPIAVEFDDDFWINTEQFQQQLNQHPLGEPLVLDLHSEGPSLEFLGITSVINEWLKNRQQSPYTVQVLRWSNPVEFVPYQRVRCSKISHCFTMVREYWQHTEPTLEQQLQYRQPFGIFIGRLTMSRAAILYNLMPAGTESIGEQIFASLMQNAEPFPWNISDQHRRNLDIMSGLDMISSWLPLHKQVDMFNWFDRCPIISVDSKLVKDQFVTPTSYIDTNTSLLQHYNRFAVEIVCETFTRGNTFFPSEKTIRPLMAAKPILVYGPQYYLARLRSLGFRTYSEIWDESYDLYQGPERWKLMRKSMNRLLECSRSDQHEVLTRAHEIAMYNRQHLSKICNHQIDLTTHDYTKI
jgi:hypothetical protein